MLVASRSAVREGGAAPQRPIVIVRTGEPVPSVLERRGQFADLIIEAIGDAPARGFAAFDLREGMPPHPETASAFVITGSAANIPTRERWMLEGEAWLRDVVAAGTPTLGICFGHQMLAQALGGEVQKNPRGREIGTIHIERLADDALFDGLPRSFQANATHIDTVVRLPVGAVALARSSLDDHHVIRFTAACYGVQYHPEIDAEVMRAYLEARREVVTAEGFLVDALLAEVSAAELGRQTLRNFIRHCVLDRVRPTVPPHDALRSSAEAP